MNLRNFIGLIWLFPSVLWSQMDSLPFFAGQPIDWAKTKGVLPKFQQKDLVVRIVRLNNLVYAFEKEGSPAWQDDWHFAEITGDRYVDGIFSGKTKFHKGWHTFVSLGDSAMKYPLKGDFPGYVASLKHGHGGIEMVLRDDPGEGEFITTITHQFWAYGSDRWESAWEIQYVSTTEIPALGNPDQHVLKLPMALRTSPRDLREPAIDYNGDGKPDGMGNVVAEFAPGAKVRRYAIHKEGDLEWSFVTIEGKISPKGLIPAFSRPNVHVAGWIPSGAFLKP
jgi:hypothetical protein